jgi:hypothetical protein
MDTPNHDPRHVPVVQLAKSGLAIATTSEGISDTPKATRPSLSRPL